MNKVEKQLEFFCENYVMENYKVFTKEEKSHLYAQEYKIKLRSKYTGGELTDQLKTITGVNVLRLNFQNIPSDI